MATLNIKVSPVRPEVADHVEHSVESVPHVESARIDLGASCVVVEHDGADPDEIIAALHEEGIEARFE